MASENVLLEAQQADATQPKPQPVTRTENFVFGIPQNGLQQKQREVPLDEPPPLPPNSELTYIGKPTLALRRPG